MTLEVQAYGMGTGRSSRLAAHRKGKGLDGRCLAVSAAEGLRNALSRNAPAGGDIKPGASGADRAAGLKVAPRAQAPAASSSPAPKQKRSPQSEIAAAAASARAAANARAATVMASPGAAGRARVCSILLSDPKNFSAAAIVAQLPHLPTDRELAAKASNFGWDDVHAEMAERTGRAGAKVAPRPAGSAERGRAVQSEANHGWGAIHADIAERTGRVAAQPKPGVSARTASQENHGWAEIHAEIAESRGLKEVAHHG